MNDTRTRFAAPRTTDPGRWRWLLTVLLFVLVGQAVGLGPADAHSELVDGSPRPGALHDDVVSDVRLTFASELSPRLAAVVVRRPGGRDRVDGSPAGLGNQLSVRVDPLDRPGPYEVSYRVVAADGHAITGSYRFALSKSAAATVDQPSGHVSRPPAATAPDEAGPASVRAGSLTSITAGADAGQWWTDPGILAVSFGLLGVVAGSLVLRPRAAAARREAVAEEHRHD